MFPFTRRRAAGARFGARCRPGHAPLDTDVDLTGLPTCSTGPVGRTSWVLKELVGVVRGRP